MDSELKVAIENSDWDSVIDLVFTDGEDIYFPARNDLKHVLDEKGEEIQLMYEEFNEKQTPEMLNDMRMHFPELSDYSNTPPQVEDYPNLTKAICTGFYIEYKIPDYYDELREKIGELRDYLDGDDNRRGRELYMDLTRGWRIKNEKAKNWLKEATSDIDTELTDYEHEYEAYENRDVSKFGLITNDAVKCLEDFKGRTFPFIRAICRQVDKNDRVLEVGAGTGILSISAAIAGADSVIGLELNPVTCVLSDIIVNDLYRVGILERKESVNIVWGDALKFGRVEYKQYSDFTFDTIISENIYTGMFFELQMQMLSRIMENELVEVKREILNGYAHRAMEASVVPSSMASAAELVDFGDYETDIASEVLIDINDKGYGIEKVLSEEQPYDIIDYNVEEPSGILAKIRFTIKEQGKIDAINIYSVVKLSDGDYITRNENEFLSNDHIVHLNNSVQVDESDEVVVTIAYNEADAVTDGIFEVRKVDKDKGIPSDYDARLDVTEREHEINKLQFKKVNKIQHDLNLYELGDMEKLRCSSYFNGYEHTWRTNLKF